MIERVSAEESAASEYEKMSQENQVTKTAQEQSVKYKTEDISAVHGALFAYMHGPLHFRDQGLQNLASMLPGRWRTAGPRIRRSSVFLAKQWNPWPTLERMRVEVLLNQQMGVELASD